MYSFDVWFNDLVESFLNQLLPLYINTRYRSTSRLPTPCCSSSLYEVFEKANFQRKLENYHPGCYCLRLFITASSFNLQKNSARCTVCKFYKEEFHTGRSVFSNKHRIRNDKKWRSPSIIVSSYLSAMKFVHGYRRRNCHLSKQTFHLRGNTYKYTFQLSSATNRCFSVNNTY